MKIALCVFKYFPYGGLQRDFLQLANALSKKHRIEIFTTAWESELPENLSVHKLSIGGITNHKRMQHFAKSAIKEAKKAGCQCIVGFNKIPGIDIYFAADNCYVAQSKEKHGFFYRLTPRYRTYAMLEKKLFNARKTPKILALTYQQKMGYQKIYRIPDENFFILPADFPIVNTHEVGQTIRQSHGIKADEYLVLMVCSAFKTKGVDRALYAIAKLPSAILDKTHVLIIGNDHCEPFLKLAKKLHVDKQVQFLGAKNNVLDYMHVADLFLHPAYHEAAGKVLLEAMSCGLPVLTTMRCGYAEHVEKAKAGVVLPSVFSDAELSNALFYMLSSTQKGVWKKQALDYVARYPKVGLIEAAVEEVEKLVAKQCRVD